MESVAEAAAAAAAAAGVRPEEAPPLEAAEEDDWVVEEEPVEDILVDVEAATEWGISSSAAVRYDRFRDSAAAAAAELAAPYN